MTSKEYLKKICLSCELDMAERKQRCPFRSISNEYCDDIQTIKNDLDKLDKIKTLLGEKKDEKS